MKQSTSCLIYPPVLLALFLSHFISVLFCCSLFCSHSLLHSFSAVLSLWSSSPLRCEQVIGQPPSYNSFVVGNAFLSIFIIQNLNLHFKTLCSFPKTLGDEGSFTVNLYFSAPKHCKTFVSPNLTIRGWHWPQCSPCLSQTYDISLFERMRLLHRGQIMSICLLITGVLKHTVYTPSMSKDTMWKTDF